MSEPIILVFTHREKEYVAATQWFYARVYHTRFLLILSSLVFSLGLVLMLFNADFMMGSVAAVTGLILFVPNFYAYFVTPSQHFRRNTKLTEEYHLRFSEEGLLFRSKDVESKLEWGFYSKVLETSQFYFLGYDKDLFTLIPKRVFASKAQERTFRELLNRKTGANLDTKGFVGGENGEYQDDSLPPPSPLNWR